MYVDVSMLSGNAAPSAAGAAILYDPDSADDIDDDDPDEEEDLWWWLSLCDNGEEEDEEIEGDIDSAIDGTTAISDGDCCCLLNGLTRCRP